MQENKVVVLCARATIIAIQLLYCEQIALTIPSVDLIYIYTIIHSRINNQILNKSPKHGYRRGKYMQGQYLLLITALYILPEAELLQLMRHCAPRQEQCPQVA